MRKQRADHHKFDPLTFVIIIIIIIIIINNVLL